MKPLSGILVACLSAMLLPGIASSAPEKTIELRVFAPSAVAQPLKQLGYQFEKEHPGVYIYYNFGPSGVFYTDIVQGIPPDIYVSAGDDYQDKLSDNASINFYSKLASDTLVAVAPCNPPPCCVAHADQTEVITQHNLARSLSNPFVSFAVASPDMSTAGRLTKAYIDSLHSERAVRDYDHAIRVLGPQNALDEVLDGKSQIAFAYASQAAGARRMGECVRTIPLPSSDATKTAYQVSVLNASKFHAVSKRRAKLDHELQALYLSKSGKKVFQEWGLAKAE